MTKHYVYPVRWIGSNYPGANTKFQSVDSNEALRQSLKWELFTCIRQRAFSYTNKNQSIGESWIGLLVDITRSDIEVIYKSDCYSLRHEASNQLVSREFNGAYYKRDKQDNGEQTMKNVRMCSNPDNRIAIKPHLTQSKFYGYHEALGYLKFSGLVIKCGWYNAEKFRQRVIIAKQWAIEFDIPFLGKIGDFKPQKYFGE